MGAFFAHSLVAHSGGVAVGECASSLHFVSKGANRPCVTNTYHTIKVGEKQPTTLLINVFGDSHVDEVAAKHGLPVLAKCPIDPELARLSDAGLIETYGGQYLEGAADACEKLLKK